MSALRLQGISRKFGEKTAVDTLDLSIASGEFFSVLGPSGCGKTTLLRMIAGFERPTTGAIVLDGRDVTGLPPGERGVGMVFQNYALFPRMTVGQNVAFGLRKKKLGQRELEAKVGGALDSVHLADRARSPVADLSGGEQQRVAVARAIVVEPGVLLFDEPLSNLDAALRASTRNEIKALQERTGITTLYVTHDQSEAMSLSTRIGVMSGGKMLQVGSPADAYLKPQTPFVAQFLGSATLLDCEIARSGRELRIGDVVVPLSGGETGGLTGAVIVAVKPEHVLVSREESGRTSAAIIRSVEYQGFLVSLGLSIGDTMVRAVVLASSLQGLPAEGDRVGVKIDWSMCTFFDKDR